MDAIDGHVDESDAGLACLDYLACQDDEYWDYEKAGLKKQPFPWNRRIRLEVENRQACRAPGAVVDLAEGLVDVAGAPVEAVDTSGARLVEVPYKTVIGSPSQQKAGAGPGRVRGHMFAGAV